MLSCIYRYCKYKRAVENEQIAQQTASCVIARESVLEQEVITPEVIARLAPTVGDSSDDEYITV